MGNFERRLSAARRRPSLTPAPTGPIDTVVLEDSTSVGWQAAERIANLVDVAPGTVIKVVVDGTADNALLEVTWDADGVPMICEL